MATLGVAFGSIPIICPIQRHHLRLISVKSGVVFVRSLVVLKSSCYQGKNP